MKSTPEYKCSLCSFSSEDIFEAIDHLVEKHPNRFAQILRERGIINVQMRQRK